MIHQKHVDELSLLIILKIENFRIFAKVIIHHSHFWEK